MTTLREAAEMALEALKVSTTPRAEDRQVVLMAQAALRESLADHFGQATEMVKPVAWMDREGDIYPMPEIEGWAPPHTMLYTAPPQREWQELTNEEIEWIKGSANRAIGYIRVTAAKLKEKNT